MPSPLTVDEFKLASLTCELRYRNSYLIYDTTGRVIEDVRDQFNDINVSASSPQQSSWVSAEGTLFLGIGTCHIISTRREKNGEAFSKDCKAFFDSVTRNLKINLFTRIGLRYVLRKEYEKFDQPKSILSSMMLANLKPPKRFNSSDSPIEVLFRWEDSDIGATVRLKAEQVEVKSTVPLELRDIVSVVEKKMNYLTVDTDYYTVAPVDREQWNPQEWIPQKIRFIRKEIDGILLGGK